MKNHSMTNHWRKFALSFAVMGLGYFNHAKSQEAEKFTLPEGFVPKLETNKDTDPSREIILTWDEVPGAILYEIEIAEHYHEDVRATVAGITVGGDAVAGFGSSQASGAFTPGSHLRIIGSANGNDGIYRVSAKGLEAGSMKLENANLTEETLTMGKATLLKIEAEQWRYYVQKEIQFAGQPRKINFTGLNPGLPHMAHIRVTTSTGGKFTDADSGFCTPNIPVYTAKSRYGPIDVVFEEVTSHSISAAWSSPENVSGQEVDFTIQQASDPKFTRGIKAPVRTNKTQYTFENLAPETPLYLRITPVPPKGKYSQYVDGPSTDAYTKSLALQPIALVGTVSTAQLTELGTLEATWEKPLNLGNEFISYNLEIASANDPGFSSPVMVAKELGSNTYTMSGLKPLTSFLFRVQAVPSKDNKVHAPSGFITGGGTTAGSTLQAPPSLEAAAGIGSLDITWSDTTNNLGKIEYEVLVQTVDPGGENQELTKKTTETRTGLITGLHKDIEYQVSVTAIPAKGNMGDLPSKTSTILIRTLTDVVPEGEPVPEEAPPPTAKPAPAPPKGPVTPSAPAKTEPQEAPAPAPQDGGSKVPTPETSPAPNAEPPAPPQEEGTEKVPDPDTSPLLKADGKNSRFKS